MPAPQCSLNSSDEHHHLQHAAGAPHVVPMDRNVACGHSAEHQDEGDGKEPLGSPPGHLQGDQ